MTDEQPKRYRLLRDYGNQAIDTANGGVRHGLAAGAVGVWEETVAASEPGAHNSEEDAHVLRFDDVAHSLGALAADGVPVVKSTPVQRRVSFALADFDPDNPDRLFEAVTE